MSKKGKKNLKAKKEILKAQGKIGKEIVEKKEKNDFELPIKNIKRDLFKTGTFALLSLTLIIVLSKNNIGYQSILNYIQTKF